MTADYPTILLASNSPRRRELLNLTNWEFDIQAAEVDETPLADEMPGDYVVRLAKTKAQASAANAPENVIILAADTTVADKNNILGKPTDENDAKEMLESLRAHSHQVMTGLAVYDKSIDLMTVELATTEVPMRDYSEAEVEEYILSGDPFDKAGSYAIQHPVFNPVENLAGCFANVMGLPLCHLARTFKNLGIKDNPEIPNACQEHLNYDCPVYELILKGEL